MIDAARMVGLIDSGDAEPVDPDDEFGPVSYDGHVWEWSDDTEGTCGPRDCRGYRTGLTTRPGPRCGGRSSEVPAQVTRPNTAATRRSSLDSPRLDRLSRTQIALLVACVGYGSPSMT